MLKRLSILFIALIITFTSINFEDVYADETEDYKTFSQLDERWSSHHVHSTDYTIGEAGCFITSIAVLMAYANPDLRDVNTFNPATLSDEMSFSGGGLVSTSCSNADSTFTKVADDDGNFSSQEATEKVKGYMEQGYYVTVRTSSSSITSSTHFSPIVGMDGDTPVLWDVAGGAHSDFSYWAECGIDQIDIFQSSLHPSTETMSDGGISNDDLPSDEELAEIESLIAEGELIGMPDTSKLAENQIEIVLPDRSELSLTEQRRTQEIGDAIESQGVSIPTWFNHILFFIGICLVFYSVLLLVVMLFDYSNQFFETSLVTMLTFGTCRIVDEDYLKDNPNSGKHTAMGKNRARISNLTIKMMVFRIALLMLIGLLIMTGIVQYYVVLVINWVLSALRS